MGVRDRIYSWFPAIAWLRQYPRQHFSDDLTAGFITAVLLIPQGMAYAILAGLPAEVGLYASILPPVIYALMGTSRTLSVGPVSVAALLVANALSASGATSGDPTYLADAFLLAALSGVVLLLMAALRLDVLVNFLGHPVLSGFTSGAAVLIVLSQLENLVGLSLPGGSGLEMLVAAVWRLFDVHLLTAAIGLSSLILLLLLRAPFIRLLEAAGVGERTASLVSRAGPLAVIAAVTTVVAVYGLHQEGVAIVGAIPAGLPSPSLSFLRLDRIPDLLPAAAMISLIGYVESISVAKVLGYRRRERIGNNQELIALGAANIAASFSGGMAVAGGFSRSMVNFSAGARTQLASIITAALVALAALAFTPLFYYLPKAVLAAIIIIAVSSLFDWRTAVNAWQYDRADGLALLVTFAGVVAIDIEVGLLAGVAIGLGAFIWRSSRPHVAIVGRVPGTEHYRSVSRHEVETWPELILIRVDRSLFFGNINYVEDTVAAAAATQPDLKHLVIICSAVNAIDHSAVEALEQLATNLGEAGVTLHLAEVKGPVMDRLRRTDLLEHLAPGAVFLSTDLAVRTLAEEGEREERVND